MKAIRILALAAFMAAFMACHAQNSRHIINVGDFNKLTVVNGVAVRYASVADSAGMAVIDGPESAVSAITFENKSLKLRIEAVSEEPVESLPVVTVYSMALAEAQNWGDSTLTVAKVNPGPKLKVSVIGNGSIVVPDITASEVEASVKAGNGTVFLSGKAQKAKYTIMSAGVIEARTMEVKDATCNMIGTGSIDCNATKSLKVKGIGSGSVYFWGTPEVKNHAVGVKVVEM